MDHPEDNRSGSESDLQARQRGASAVVHRISDSSLLDLLNSNGSHNAKHCSVLPDPTFPSLRTPADESNDRTTLDRALEQRLVLIVKPTPGAKWRLPESAWQVRPGAAASKGIDRRNGRHYTFFAPRADHLVALAFCAAVTSKCCLPVAARPFL